MYHTSLWLRRSLAIAVLAVASALAVASHSTASPATFPHDEPLVEAENGDWPW